MKLHGVLYKLAKQSDVGAPCLATDDDKSFVEGRLVTINQHGVFLQNHHHVYKRAYIMMTNYSQENLVEPTQPEPQECILDIAKKLTRGDRNASYGHPSQDFIRTAGMMNALFGDMLKEGCKFEPQHIAMMMILVKLSRQRHQNKRDNWIDIAGYSDCGDRCPEDHKELGS